MIRRAARSGFSLVELLIILVVVALISVIVIPLMLSTFQVSKQKRTMSDINLVGKAMMSWVSDQAGAAAAGGAVITVPINDWGAPLDQEDIEDMLVPQYLPNVPMFDAWGGQIEYRLMTGNLSSDKLMAIRSAGADRIFSTDTYVAGPFDPRIYTEDLVWVDGVFMRWPQKPVDD